jgi:hypothetical protein
MLYSAHSSHFMRIISFRNLIQLGFLISLLFSAALQAQDKSQSLKSYLEGNWGGPGCVHPTELAPESRIP